MFPTTTDPTDEQRISAQDCWVQRQMEEAMRHLPADLEVLPSPLLLEQMQHQAVQLRSPSARLVARRDPAAKPASFSRRRKRRQGAPSCFSAGEEESPMSSAETSGAVVSLPADGDAAASIPTSSSATAMSPRLDAAPPMPSPLAPARCSEATPDELEERLSHKSAAAVQPTSGLQSAAAVQPMSCLQRAAAAQSTSCLQSAAAAAEQPTPGLQSASAAAAVEQSMPGLQPAAEFPGGSEDEPPLLPVPEGSEDEPPLLPVPEGSEDEPPLLLVPEGSEDGLPLILFQCPLTVFQAELTHSLTPSLTPSLPQPPPHAAEDVGRRTPRLKSLRFPATPRLKSLRFPATPQLKSLRFPATPQLLRTPLRVSVMPQLLRMLLRVSATPELLHTPLRVSRRLSVCARH
ncbi:hypothetical protein CRENBAI_000612 [Crenichthys baileyi]|uniref:Uncharacterized protein n=1 Tax=Crenichthys baileyi TaxID=28760 RepID=A0AAV9S060_9TELE